MTDARRNSLARALCSGCMARVAADRQQRGAAGWPSTSRGFQVRGSPIRAMVEFGSMKEDREHEARVSILAAPVDCLCVGLRKRSSGEVQ
jgi:hypothetical protein